MKTKKKIINNSESIKSEFSRYQLECLLPDYVFNRLSAEECAMFEIGIVNFPDLEQETREAQKLFSEIDNFDFKKVLNDKSQYLPDRVVANLESRNIQISTSKPNMKRLILAGIFAASLLIYMLVMKDDFPIC